MDFHKAIYDDVILASKKDNYNFSEKPFQK